MVTKNDKAMPAPNNYNPRQDITKKDVRGFLLSYGSTFDLKDADDFGFFDEKTNVYENHQEQNEDILAA